MHRMSPEDKCWFGSDAQFMGSGAMETTAGSNEVPTPKTDNLGDSSAMTVAAFPENNKDRVPGQLMQALFLISASGKTVWNEEMMMVGERERQIRAAGKAFEE